MQVQSLGREDPLEEGMTIHPVLLREESYGQRRLTACSPGAHAHSINDFKFHPLVLCAISSLFKAKQYSIVCI